MKNYEEHGYFDIDIRQQIDNEAYEIKKKLRKIKTKEKE